MAAPLLAAEGGTRLVRHRMPWLPREQDHLDWGPCWAVCLRDRPRLQLVEVRRGPRQRREAPLYRWLLVRPLLGDSRPSPLRSEDRCSRLIGQYRARLAAPLQVAAGEEPIQRDWEPLC